MRNKFSKIALAAGILLALAFTLGCSPAAGDDGGSSSSSVAVPGSSSSLPLSSSSSEANSLELSSSSTAELGSDGGNPGRIESLNKFEAKPASEVGKDKIKYSYSYGGYDFYYIYLGELKNIPLFGYPTEYHDGTKTTYTVSNAETIKQSVAETITNSSQTAIGVVEEHTYSTTNKQKVSAEIKASTGWGPVKAEAKAAAEASWEQYTRDNKTSSFHKTTSLTNTIANGTEYTKTTLISRSWELGKDNKDGYYKYTLFSASDVYIYVIKDATGVIYYEFKECVIPDVYFWRFDYSETPSFRKSDATSFEFDVSMLDNLPKPDISLLLAAPTLTANATAGGSVERIPNQAIYNAGTQVTLTAMPNNNYVFSGWTGNLPAGVDVSRASITFTINSDITLTANFRALVEKTETVEYTAIGNPTYTFDKGFPATIEIYALGAGGGGQGGNRSHWINANPFKGSVGDKNDIGTGGSGGGGAAAYMKLSAEQPVTFNIKVGKGGSGGGGYYADWNDTWESGNPGSSGESTSVAVGSRTLVAEGGGGAGGSGQSLDGGTGGRKSTAPANPLDFASEAGKKGSDGQHMADIRGSIQGGQAAMIEKGSEKSFGGGLGAKNGVAAQAGGGGIGGYNDDQSGTPGGDGQVIIVITYTSSTNEENQQ